MVGSDVGMIVGSLVGSDVFEDVGVFDGRRRHHQDWSQH